MLVLSAFISTSFQVVLAQQQQQQQQTPTTSNNTLSSSAATAGINNQTLSSTSPTANTTNNNETGIGQPLPSPTQANTTMLRGEIGSIQTAHDGTFSWSTGGDWMMRLDGPLTGRPNPHILSFNATIHMVRLDGNVLHEHKIYNFNQTSVSQIGDQSTIFNGTMTVTLREGPVQNIPGYIHILGDSIAIWVDPRAVANHFGQTPIYGIVLPPENVGEQRIQ